MEKEKGESDKVRREIKQTKANIKTRFLYWLGQGGEAYNVGLKDNLKGLSDVWLHKWQGPAVCID